MRLAGSVRILGIAVLLLLVGGSQATAQDEPFCEVIDAAGTPVSGEGEGTEVGTPADVAVDAVGTPETGTPMTEGPDETGTPVTDLTDMLGDDGVLDANDEWALCQDMDGDGTNEIGIDQDESGTFDEDEVLGSDIDNDEALTGDELDPEVAEPSDD